MIKFYDSAGTVHFGQATITRKTSVNGGLSLTGEVFAGNDVLNGLDYGWWLNFDNEKYVITYKKLSDDTNTVIFDAVQQFFWDFAKVALHTQYNGSHEYKFYLNKLFNGSSYNYKNDATVPAFEKENWGYKNKLDLFNDIMDQANVEFEVHNETVHIAKQLGSDLTNFVRKGINLSDLTEEMKISDFATYARGYGAFKDDQDKSKGRLEVEYRSELAKKFGDLEMDPIVDERYAVADNLIAALKKQVDATYTVSMTMNIYDLENAGYPNYKAPKVGDWILAIDEALNFKRKIRIIKLEEQFDVTGKRIGYTATCGDLNIVDQYTKLQVSLDSKVQRIQKSVDAAATSANGKSTNYYGAKEPASANKGDLWFDQSNDNPDKWSIKQRLNGRWEQITLNPGEISDKVDVAKKEAETATENAKQLAAKYDDTNALASQAFNQATSAQTDASDAVSKAESAASEFGKVDQKADSAFDNAMSAQSDASSAVKQASSAAADSKDAKQIAGAVSQSYKTLTDGSTMTIAELENGLAAKLTKTDLDGYATQVWTQNKIKVTADDISGNLSSVKKTVDGQTTSINDLKADSSSFKSQFTTVNNTLGKQSTDIGTLKATSKELSSGFNTLTTDNNTNKNDISQLKQTSTKLSSTMEAVQTQVQNSAVGTNLIVQSELKNGYLNRDNGGVKGGSSDFHSDSYIATNGETVFTFSSPDYVFKGSSNHTLAMYDSNKKYLGYQKITSATQTLSKSNVAYIRFSINFRDEGSTSGNLSDWLDTHRYKLEKGSVATDWCPNPADNASVTALSKLSQTVDGMKLNISKKIEQKDLNGYATETWAQNQINVTANGINSTLSSVKTTVDGHETSINDLKADSNDFKSQFTKVNDTLGEQTTDIGTLQASSKYLSANFDSLSSDNQTNQHNISQLQASATKFNSTLMTVQQRVTDSAVGTNLLLKTGTPFSMTGNNTSNQVGSAYSLANRYNVSSLASALGTQFTISYDWSVSGDSPSGTFATQWNNVPWGIDLAVTVSSSNASGHVSHTFSVSTDSKNVGNGLDIRLDNFVGSITISNVKLEKGSLATDWCPNPADNATVTALSSISQTIDSIQTTVRGKVDNETYQSKINQLSDQINLRVESKGVINAVNVSKEGTSIYGNKLHITADTYIDNAVIKDAMIESIKADKIYTGTLDAANVNVIHLNAGNITTGTIKGANLSINLTTGEILFQKGTIKSTNGNLNIDIDSGKMAVVNSSGNGFRFENGKLYLTSNTWVGWGQSKPDYGSITYEPNFLSNVKGMKISGTDGIAVTTGDYPINVGDWYQTQPSSGAALTLNQDNAFLNAREFTRIEGGSTYNDDRATIIVGGANGTGNYKNIGPTGKYGEYVYQYPVKVGPDIYMNGRKITLQGGSRSNLADLNLGDDGKPRISSAAIYKRTYSSGNKVAITSYGTLGRITSARKYKIADTPALNVISKAKRVLDIKPAEWYDKAEIESIADAKTNGTEAPGEAKIEKHYGFIADDFDAAGLTEVVLYKDGEVDSLDYDRISIYHNVILTDHEKRIAELEEEIKQLKGEI